jgi:hypothetical protein
MCSCDDDCAQICGNGQLKRLTLELGGKSPMVVFDDADLDQVRPTFYGNRVLTADRQWQLRILDCSTIMAKVVLQARVCLSRSGFMTHLLVRSPAVAIERSLTIPSKSSRKGTVS